MVWERERRTVFEDSDTDWHLYPALEGSLDGKRSLPLILPPGLPSPPSRLEAGSLGPSQPPGPSGPSVLSPSSSGRRRGARSFLFHAELGHEEREGINKSLWLCFPELMVIVC